MLHWCYWTPCDIFHSFPTNISLSSCLFLLPFALRDILWQYYFLKVCSTYFMLRCRWVWWTAVYQWWKSFLCFSLISILSMSNGYVKHWNLRWAHVKCSLQVKNQGFSLLWVENVTSFVTTCSHIPKNSLRHCSHCPHAHFGWDSGVNIYGCIWEVPILSEV